MDWKLYEEITRYIYETLGKNAGVKIEGFGKDCKVEGKSGIEHQIDVLTSHSDGIHTYKTAIECKYWKDTVNKDIVMKLSGIVEDASINKGVIVSRKGFTPDAIGFAKHVNIGLVELREIEETDLENKPFVRIISSKLLRPEITNVIIRPSLFNRSEIEFEEVKTDSSFIEKSNGELIPFLQFYKEFKMELKSHPVNKKIEKKIFIPLSKLINKETGKMLYIDAIILKGVLTEREIDLKFHPVDEVWMIMKLIFEEKSYTISKAGIIKEDETK